MKYIMFLAQTGSLQMEFPIIFPKQLIHKFVAASMIPCFKACGFLAIPISAGEISIFGTDLRCSGESITLKLKSRPQDSSIIHNFEYLNGIENPVMEEILKKALAEREASKSPHGPYCQAYHRINGEKVFCGGQKDHAGPHDFVRGV